jgi:4-carboxymuconolactone decarboxylase
VPGIFRRNIMTDSEKIIKFIRTNREQEQLILLSALSVLWLTPQNVDARRLIVHYREKDFQVDALREAALQLFLVAGFQASVEAAFLIKDVYGDGMPSLGEHPEKLGIVDLMERGYRLQSKVYRENIEKLRSNMQAISPELSEWTVLVGYGLVLSRNGIAESWRELFEIGVLAAQGFPRQLHSHIKGALHLGATSAEVELVLRIVELVCPPDKSQSAWQMWWRIKK